MTLRKINEMGTSGPKGQRIWLIDVRAKARTYPKTAFSAACLAPVNLRLESEKAQGLKPRFLLGFYGPTKVVP
jgi:hypothetical protein